MSPGSVKLNIKQIAESLAPSQETILTQICPGGTISGREYMAGSISGGPGKSFSFNLQTGKWADFATGEKGGDIVSLYAQVNRINNAEAARILQEQYVSAKPQHHYPVKTVVDITIIKPPRHAVKPEKPLNKGQEPSYSWTYRDVDSEPLFYIFRYDMPDGTKTFTPLSFSSTGQWVKKHYTSPRPLYNLDKLTQNPNKHVLIVEGEKAADAAEKMQSLYVVTTWPGGVNAIGKTDFTPLHGRKLLMWPDGDQPGIKGMSQLAAKLREHAEEIKIINPDRNSGWDAYDAFTGGMTQSEFIKWAKPLVTVIEKHEPVDLEGRTDYSDPAIRHVDAEIINDKPTAATYMSLGMTIKSDKNPTPHESEYNAAIAIAAMPKYKGHIWFDEFHKTIMTDHTTGEIRRWDDSERFVLQLELQSKFGMPTIGHMVVARALSIVSSKDQRNQLKDWLKSLVWDGEPRIDSYLHTVYGTPDDELHRSISSNWLKSMVARGTRPGCKVDTVLVIRGAQGIRKTSSLEALAREWYAELNVRFDNEKELGVFLSGKWIVEIGELRQFKAVSPELIKSKLSARSDEVRIIYKPNYAPLPRTCIFAGTTNKPEFSYDETGNRRFWPIEAISVDIDYIEKNREQIFAEALHRIDNLNESWWEVHGDIINAQEKIRVAGAYEEMISTYLNNNYSESDGLMWAEYFENDDRFTPKIREKVPLTVQNICRFALRLDRADAISRESRSVAKSMRAIGFQTRKTRINGVGAMVFFNDDYKIDKATENLVAD